MASKKIVIIGGGAAGFFSAQAARAADDAAVIFLICGEKTLPYFRTRICEVLSGLSPASLLVKPAQWFEDKNIEIIQDAAQKIDTVKKTVFLKNGGLLSYDSLIVATGAQGNRLPVSGNDLPGVMAFRTLNDIADSQKYGGDAIVIGGGLLGLEAAWHLNKAGRKVTIIEYAPWLLGRQLDAEAADFFHEIVKKAGFAIVTSAQLTQISGQAPALLAQLADGRSYSGGLIVFAAGIIPEVSLAKESGLAVNRAIVVDQKMRAAINHIYACGDCAEYQGKVAGLWSVSMAQGAVAGKNAAGGDAAYQPEDPPYLLNAMGTKIWSNGSFTTDDAHTVAEPEQGLFKKIFFQEGKTIGAILIGDVALQAKLKEAIKLGLAKAEAIKFVNNI